MKLQENEFAPYYANYIIKSLLHTDILEGLKKQQDAVVSFFTSLPSDKLEYQYQTGKWTPKDILLHLNDAERIFAYRALRISRNDQTPLSGFEEDDYVPFGNANVRSIENLIDEYVSIRNATITLFKNFSEEDLMRIGIASNASVSVRAIGYIILGHELHHMSVIKERYL
ncbi:Damage-inducible protein DinB [Flavobacterium sp. 9AF]|uniref:DinB family protein n=1 Tax=Flavobacterium sp. 9AF TaxID=2653142 RepID=UPI0012F435B3|nr:DinB family protein [Flavobacterium sp. 9AF]VXA99814.1 Damage-inducible protein DinB [Flavobacterium sp. 9AF]